MATKFLFIGNSYTYKPSDKDCLPQQFKTICKNNKVDVDVTMITEGGWTLEQHWNNSATITALKSKKYKYVIIQGQSDEVGCKNGKLSAKAKTYAKKLGDLAKQHGSKVWFMAQADYFYRVSNGKKTYYNMKYQDQVDANYRTLANSCNAWVFFGGKKVKDISNGKYETYFANDGYHPTAKTQKLVAQCLWDAIKKDLLPKEVPAIKEVKVKQAAKSFNKSYAGTYEVTAGLGLHLRDGAGQTNKSLAVMPKGTKFTCYGYYTMVGNTPWLYGIATVNKVKYTAFCSKNYLKKVNDIL